MKKKGIDSPPPLPKPETVSDDAVRLEEKEQEEIDARIKAARIREAKMDNIRLRMKIVQESKLLTQSEIEEQTHELEQELERLEAAGVEPTPPREEEPPPAGDAEKLPPKQEEAAELANDGEKGTSLENRRKFLDVMARMQEVFGKRESPVERLVDRSKEFDAKAKKMGRMEKFFRNAGEKYNKLPLWQKIALSGSLALGYGLTLPISGWLAGAYAIPLFATRLAAMGGSFMRNKERFEAISKGEGRGRLENTRLYTWFASGPEKSRENKAMLKALLWSFGMAGGLSYAAHELAEYQVAERIGQWITEHITGGAGGKEIVGAGGPPPPPHIEAPAATAAPHIPEMPSVGASAGHGYEYMMKRLWEDLHARGVKLPENIKPDSDLAKLLHADSASIDAVVHHIAADPQHAFFHADGTSVQVDPSAHLTIGADGELHLTDAAHPDMVHAAENMRVTPPYHPEAPVPAASAAAPVPAEAVPPPAPHATAESAAQPAAPETRAPVIEHGFIVNKFDVTIPVYEPHIYADAGAKHLLVYGGSPLERANAIQEYLAKNPNGVVFSADDSGKYRIPWHLVGGKAIPGMPVETRGFLGFFKSFMKAPGPDEFAKVVN